MNANINNISTYTFVIFNTLHVHTHKNLLFEGVGLIRKKRNFGSLEMSAKCNKTKKSTIQSVQMCSSRKNPYPPHGRSLEIPRGRGGS